MFKQLSIFLVVCAILAHAAITFPTQDEYDAELKADGMSPSGVKGLHDLNMKFANQFIMAQASNQSTDKAISDYTSGVESFVKSMSPKDQQIYLDSLKKYGLA